MRRFKLTSPHHFEAGRNPAAFANPGGGRRRIFIQRGQGQPRIRLFDPNLFLALIVVLCWPLKYFPIVLIPSLLLGGINDGQALGRHLCRSA